MKHEKCDDCIEEGEQRGYDLGVRAGLELAAGICEEMGSERRAHAEKKKTHLALIIANAYATTLEEACAAIRAALKED